MSERAGIAALLVALLFGIWVCGVFVFRLMVDQVPNGRLKWVATAWSILFLLMPLPQLWLKSYMTGGASTYGSVLAGNLLFYAVPAGGWLWSVFRRRRQSGR